MCGIFGFAGKKGKPVNLYKLMILGLYNESRGTDSCGYYFNGNVVKGTGLDAKFSEFLSDNKLEKGGHKQNVFIGHTRKGTGGASSQANAHPHVVGDYVQVHNGVIKNIWTICNKHKVDHTGITVDSMALAHLITKVGIKETLESYTGYAALAFTYMSNPGTVYLYHGRAKEAKQGMELEERPMYALKQPEGIYFSSIKTSLNAINSSTEEEPFILVHNKVVEITDGEFTGNMLEVERGDMNVEEAPFFGTRPNYAPVENKNNYTLFKGIANVKDLIMAEELPSDLFPNKPYKVFYNKGVYSFFDTVTNVIGIDNSTYQRRMNGSYVINRDGFIVPKITDPGKESTYYFIDGIMIKTHEDYLRCKELGWNTASENGFVGLSTRSKYPVIQIKNNYGIGKTLWYHNGTLVRKETLRPKFTNRSYRICHGVTKAIQR